MLLENLLQRGSRSLVSEISDGHHFDIVQRLSFLEQFENSVDKRVESMVRQKAKVLRADVLAKIEAANSPDSSGVVRGGHAIDTKKSTADESTSQGGGSTKKPHAPVASLKGQTVLNGIVAVGHRDDTTSESSGDDEALPRGRRQRKPQTTRRRQERRDQVDLMDMGPSISQPVLAPAPVPVVDLLDM